jgi:hypothetical protein
LGCSIAPELQDGLANAARRFADNFVSQDASPFATDYEAELIRWERALRPVIALWEGMHQPVDSSHEEAADRRHNLANRVQTAMCEFRRSDALGDEPLSTTFDSISDIAQSIRHELKLLQNGEQKDLDPASDVNAWRQWVGEVADALKSYGFSVSARGDYDAYEKASPFVQAIVILDDRLAYPHLHKKSGMAISQAVSRALAAHRDMKVATTGN